MVYAPQSTGRLVAVLAALALVSAPATAQEPETQTDPASGIEVIEAVVATGVEDRAPVGAGESFGPDVGTLFFYTAFEGDFPQTQVEHVWLYDGEEVGRVSLRAQGPRWRTWSSKQIRPDWRGEWQAQVIGPDGEVLASTSFTIDG